MLRPMRIRPLLGCALALVAACASPDPAPSQQPTAASAPAASTAPTPSAAPSGSATYGMIELGPSLGGGQVPHAATFEIHLPGTDAKRYLNATVTLGLGTESTIEGCISSAPGACSATERIVLGKKDHEEYIALWKEVLAMPRCEPPGKFPGDRAFRIDAAKRSFADALPAKVADLPTRTKDTCEAPRRLAWWLARRMKGL